MFMMNHLKGGKISFWETDGTDFGPDWRKSLFTSGFASRGGSWGRAGVQRTSGTGSPKGRYFSKERLAMAKMFGPWANFGRGTTHSQLHSQLASLVSLGLEALPFDVKAIPVPLIKVDVGKPHTSSLHCKGGTPGSCRWAHSVGQGPQKRFRGWQLRQTTEN